MEIANCSTRRIPQWDHYLRLCVASILLLVLTATIAPAQNGVNLPPNNASINSNFANGGFPAQPLAQPVNGNAPAQFPSSSANSATPLNRSEQSNTPEKSIAVGNLLSLVRQGGILMLPLIGCSVLMLVFVMERLLFLRRSKTIPRPFVRGVMEQLEQQQLSRDEAIALCEENGSLIAQLFGGALRKYGKPAVEVEQAVLDAGERVVSMMKKYLRLFSAISNLAPLLGLLGTVVGMIDAFNTIASADAMGRPELLAGGIGTALITTAAGLLVAIPAYIAYVFFLGRIDKLILEMDALAQNVVELISSEGLQESKQARSRARARAA
jgi:biopolymer transport protein ExbB